MCVFISGVNMFCTLRKMAYERNEACFLFAMTFGSRSKSAFWKRWPSVSKSVEVSVDEECLCGGWSILAGFARHLVFPFRFATGEVCVDHSTRFHGDRVRSKNLLHDDNRKPCNESNLNRHSMHCGEGVSLTVLVTFWWFSLCGCAEDVVPSLGVISARLLL